MLIVFAYVDLFSLYRPDVRAAIEAGQISGFSIDQTFLLATTFYIVIPSLMLVATLLLRPRVNRIVNITLSVAYVLMVVAAAIGEWNYYLLGSAVEVALLGSVAYYAWSWPRLAPSPSATARAVTTHPSVRRPDRQTMSWGRSEPRHSVERLQGTMAVVSSRLHVLPLAINADLVTQDAQEPHMSQLTHRMVT